MTAIRSRHGRLLQQLIFERRELLKETLVNTLDARTAGMITGLDEALKLSEEAEYILQGEEVAST